MSKCLAEMCTQPQLDRVTTGIRKFLKLTSLALNPREVKWVQDEMDLLTNLKNVKELFQYTRLMIGKTLYKNTPYNPVHDVIKDVETLLFFGNNPKEQALQRKRHHAMYEQVILPVIALFDYMDHQQILTVVTN